MEQDYKPCFDENLPFKESPIYHPAQLEYFAAAALQGLLANANLIVRQYNGDVAFPENKHTSEMVIKYAKELINQLNKEV